MSKRRWYPDNLVVSGNCRSNRQHDVNGEKFSLGKGDSGEESLEEKIEERQQKQEENDVEKKRCRSRMARVAKLLHLDEPPGVNRDQNQAKQYNASADGLLFRQ